MKSWLKNTLWLVFFVLLALMMSFVNNSHDERIVGMPKVNIKVHEDMVFLTEENLIQRLADRNLVGEEKTYTHLELEKIEDVLTEMPEVKSAEVYSFVGGEWKIEVSLRQPIARIFNQNGSSCYLDNDGTLMPLSNNYTAHVLTVDGSINEDDYSKNVEDIINNDSLKTIEKLDDLYAISNYVCLDKRLSAQITHIHINEFDEFELIPRVGDQRIMFGKAEWIAGKFKKLEYFYTEGLNRVGWQEYDTINIMYKSQVVCSKRN